MTFSFITGLNWFLDLVLRKFIFLKAPSYKTFIQLLLSEYTLLPNAILDSMDLTLN